MSYMNQADFAPVSGIQELNLDEIGAVEGGALPFAAAAALAAGGGFLLGVGVAVVLIYAVSKM